MCSFSSSVFPFLLSFFSFVGGGKMPKRAVCAKSRNENVPLQEAFYLKF